MELARGLRVGLSGWALSSALMASSVIVSMPLLVPASAQAAQVQFTIPKGPLSQALAAFGRQSGLQITYLPAIARDKTSPGIAGSATPQQALSRLLRGTGLSYTFTNSSTVAITAPVVRDGTASISGAIELDPVVVDGNGDGSTGYVATRSVAGTKTNTPLIETPQSVTVLTRKELNDRNIQSLTQAVAYTPGVRTESAGFDSRYDSFSIRGFDVTYNGIYRDGLRFPGANMAVFKIDPYNVENISVLRGPSSALYGLGSPGGLVDVTSKLPVDKSFGEVALEGGNRNHIQGNFDVGGPLDAQQTLLYRLTGTLRDGKTANVLGGGDDKLASLAPAFTWRPNDQTTLTILGEYLQAKTPAAFPYYEWLGSPSNQYSQSDPDYNSLEQKQYRIGYQFEHKFNDTFTFRQKLRYGGVDTKVRFTGISEIDANAMVAKRYTGYVHDRLKALAVDNQLQADFSTGPIQHKTLVGLDYSNLTLRSGLGYGTAPDLDLTTGASLGAFTDPPFNTSNMSQRQNQLGLYVQEQAKYDNWILTLTGRQDWVQTKTYERIDNSTQHASDNAFTGRVGLTYLFDNGLAPYVSYSTSFNPNLGSADGVAFKPTTGRQIEGGVKYAPTWFDGMFTASIFDVTQDGGIVSIQNVSVQRGKIRGRGVELEAVANLGAGFSLRGAYTFLDLKTITGDVGTVGKVPTATPRNSFSTWVDYQAPGDIALAGFGAGFGLRYIGESYGDAKNTFKNDAVALVDAKLSYDLGQIRQGLKGWDVQANARNLFDKKYVTCESGFCYQGARRVMTASLRYRW